MSAPYYQDDHVTLWHGDFRDVLPALDITADAIVTDPPYGETSLDWDVWPAGWPTMAAEHARSMWCFGSMRMFLDRRDEFAAWKLSQDIVWEKHNGSGFHADRFRRIHEHTTHWYRGEWSEIRHETPTTATATARTVRRKARPAHTGHVEASSYTSIDGGPRLMESVIYARSMHGRAIHPTEKPVAILEPLIEYAVAPGGVVLDRKAVLIEAREDQCEKTALRLSQGVLDFGASA